jgi:isopenicillin-N N-acyltransferase-like protein
MKLAGSASAMGHAHGRAHPHEIRAYTNERIDLVSSGLWSGDPIEPGAVLELAEACLPVHEKFSPRLHEEMMAMADGAGISGAEAIIVGGFTDFVDTVRGVMGGDHPESLLEDDCTAAIVPDHRSDGAGFLAQTWDMHDTATEHVVLLQLDPDDRPAALIFSTTGCLGQIGMNSAGVCVGINNLTGSDGRIGVTWPTVVREMLTTETAAAALTVLLDADLAGAHNYLIFDSSGVGYNVEGMPSVRPVTELDADPVVHTNHTIDPGATAVEAARPPELVAGSTRRLETARRMLADREVTVDDLFALTREPDAICQRSVAPYHVESSGAVVMRPRTGDFWACWGPPVDNDFTHLSLEAAAPSADSPAQAAAPSSAASRSS